MTSSPSPYDESSRTIIREQLRDCKRNRKRANKRAKQEKEKMKSLLPEALALGITKTDLAQVCQVSRPTLDAWIKEAQDSDQDSAT